MDEFEDAEASPAEELVQCKICERSFFPKVLKKHVPICQKAAAKRRKVFDSGRQRAEGTDISTVKPIKPKAEPPKKTSNWRRKHEEFIATIRASKGITQVMKEGGPLPPPPPPSYDPDLIQCPCCQRRFSENAAERHIKFCREQAARMGNKGKTTARTQVRPPAAKKVGSPGVTAVSSSSSFSPATSSSASRLPQRFASGQPSGIPSSKAPSAESVRSISSGYGLTSPPSGIGGKQRPAGVKNTPSTAGLNKRKVYNNYNSRNDAKSSDEVDSCGTQANFCHECGTKYPVEGAKFCCECGVRRMCI